jgi:hypothetical protein
MFLKTLNEYRDLQYKVKKYYIYEFKNSIQPKCYIEVANTKEQV